MMENEVCIMKTEYRNEIDTLVRLIADSGLVSKIILFGSLAHGAEDADSDIDLCILTPIKDIHPTDITINLRMKLYGTQKLPLDMITYNHDEFIEHAKRPSSFEHEIVKHGVTLYEC
jgi:predicted nucleotidyltransferase